jgi:adenylate cyclase
MTSLIDLNQSLNRGTKVLLVMDVVESVRLMEADEDGFVQRWQQLVQQAEQILPLHGGRIVKSLGDGLMLEFLDAAGCVKAAFALQTFSRLANQGFAGDRQMHLYAQLRSLAQ